MRAVGIVPGTCKSLEDVKVMVDGFLGRDGAGAVDQLNFASTVFELPPQYDLRLFGRWARAGRLSLQHFAPYAAHVVGVELFFRIALGAGLIGTADANNRTDIGYLFYAPFCHVFATKVPEPRDPKEDAELVAHINRLSSAASIPEEEVDFDPLDAEFVQIQRRVSKRRGSWWQLPKDLQG